MGKAQTLLFTLLALLAATIALALLAAQLASSPSEQPAPRPPALTETTGKAVARILVLVDNEALDPRLATTWGLSIYVETPYARVLFDAGPSPELLRENAATLGVDLASIDAIVLSHEHGDHVLGITAVKKHGFTVYVPRGSTPSLISWLRAEGYNVVAVNSTTRIAPQIYVVGPVYGPPYEQALAVNTSRGLVLLVGCSHPGVDTMVSRAIKDLKTKVYAVIGGFHMVGAPPDHVKKVVDTLISLGVEKIYPLHCSGDRVRAYLAKTYPEKYGDGGAGLQIVVPLAPEAGQ